MRAAQRVIGIPVMIEGRSRPFFRLVALLAFFTEAIRVDVSYGVTTDTLFRRLLVAILEMAGVTGRLAVCKLELEVGLVVIESGFSPFLRRVAAGTVFTQFARVRIVVGVAVGADLFGFPVLAVGAVAGNALGLGVPANQPVIGEAMIEIIPVQQNYPGIASTMIAVAGFTVLAGCVAVLAVESPFFCHVVRDQVMTVEAQFFLTGIA